MSDAAAVPFSPSVEPQASARADDKAERDAALASLFEGGVAGIAEVDVRTRRFIRVNRRYCELMRRSEAEMLTLGPRDLVFPEERDAYEAEWKAAAKQGVWQGEVRHRLGDGALAYMWVGFSIFQRSASGAPLRNVCIIQDITERVAATETLRVNEELLRLGQKIGRIATFVCDLTADRVACNRESREIIGLPLGETDLPAQVWRSVIAPEDRPRVAAIIAAALANRATEIEYGFRITRGGESETRHFEMRARYVYDDFGQPLRAVAVAIDVTESVRAAEKLRESEELRRMGTQVGRVATYTRDLRTGVMTISSGARAVLGLPPGDAPLTTAEWMAVFDPADRERVAKAIARSLARGEEEFGLEYRIRRPSDGAIRYLDLRAQYFYDEAGRPERAIGVCIDVTERRLAEDRLAHAAHHDALTGLPNRTRLRERFTEAVERGRRGEGFAVLCLDLDRFKVVNDTLGHAVGDRLLVEATARIGATLGAADVLARLGGDEFAILQARVEDRAAAAALAQRLIAEVSQPYAFDGHMVLIGVSVGIALYPGDGAEPDDLLRAADMALYQAKAEGRGCHAFFLPEMNARMQMRRQLELDLRHALERGEFELFYQPVLDVASRRIVGFEALIRWRRADGRLATPDVFIPLCEESGLIAPIGAWALGEACRQAATWDVELSIAVNLSPLQFSGRRLEVDVAAALAASGLAPTRLELEITESAVLHETEATLAALGRLKAQGIKIAMDDFGAGYSSLSHLQRFPFDRVKIDRAFTQEIARSRKTHAIVKAMTELCSALQMSTTAEGVETEAQFQAVAHIGCQYAQGYLFSPPRPAEEIPALLLRFAVARPGAVAAA